MAQFSFKRHHDANILNDKHVVCTVKCWRHGCNHVVFNVKLGHAALILNILLRLCLCLCLCSEFAKSLIFARLRSLPQPFVPCRRVVVGGRWHPSVNLAYSPFPSLCRHNFAILTFVAFRRLSAATMWACLYIGELYKDAIRWRWF